MPDIRDVLNSLSPDHKAMWNEHRTCMRRCYLAAVNSTIGIDKFEQQDDSFLDLIDIRLALLFDRAGLINSTTILTGKEEAKEIEDTLTTAEDAAKTKTNNLSKIDKAISIDWPSTMDKAK